MYKLMKLEEYDEGFKDIFRESDDYALLVGIALMESGMTPVMLMKKNDRGDWRTWSMYYEGRAVSI